MSLLERRQIAGMNSHYRLYSIDDFFSSLRRSHIVSAEIWSAAHHFLLDSAGYQDTKAFGQKARGYGVSVVCLCPEQNNPKPHNIAARDPELIRRTRAYFENAIRAAAELECPRVLVTPGWSFLSEPVEEAWKRSVEMLSHLCGFGQSQGVRLAMEALQPGESRLVNTVGHLQAMLGDVGSPQLNVALDLGAMTRMGETIQQYFDAFGPRLDHVHFVDCKREPFVSHLAWGDGDRSLAEDLSVFHTNGYKGYFSFEFVNGRYFREPWDADAKALSQLSSLMGEGVS